MIRLEESAIGIAAGGETDRDFTASTALHIFCAKAKFDGLTTENVHLNRPTTTIRAVPHAGVRLRDGTFREEIGAVPHLISEASVTNQIIVSFGNTDQLALPSW